MSRGKLNTTELDFTSSGTTQSKITASLNQFTYTGNTGSNDVLVKGISTPISGNDSANKDYVDRLEQYDAIVDASGNGDYTTLSAAVTAGELSIYIRSGVYSESSDISFSNNAYIVGENKNDTIIDFGTNDSSLILSSGGTPVFNGTIGITSGTTTVNGTTTTFDTSLSPGDYILLNETYYEISTVTDATTLDLVKTYNGVTLSSEGYIAVEMIKGIFKNFTVQASGTGTASLMELNNTLGVIIENMCFIDARADAIEISTGGANTNSELLLTSTLIDSPTANGISMLFAFQCNVTQTIIKNAGDNGLLIDASRNIIINGVNVTNCGDDGMELSDTPADSTISEILVTDSTFDNNSGNGINILASGFGLTFVSCACTNNGGDGMTMGGGSNTISGCTIDFNSGDGISFTATSDTNTIVNNQFRNNGGYGINISVAGATNNSIIGNISAGNTTGQIQDLGTNTTMIGNIPQSGIANGVQTDGIIITSNSTAATSETTGSIITSGGVGISGATYTNTLFINNESIAGQRILTAYDSTGGVALSGTVTGLIFDTSPISDTGLSINTVTGVVTVTDAGTYSISYWVSTESVNNSGGARSIFTSQIQTDPAGGTTFATITGSSSSGYIREGSSASIAYGCEKEWIFDITAGTTLRISYSRTVGTSTARTRANESSICIKRLRP